MIKEGVNGFCMALADSVPGVSGGTVAFIMGFYDDFISSVHDLVFGKMEEKKKALSYLVRLGIGWVIGMILAVLILSALFESHIYVVSSLFIGFIVAAIPLIIKEEKAVLTQKKGSGALCCLFGILLVVGITFANTGNTGSQMNLEQFSVKTAVTLFFIGAIAISAMFLPGISGSTMLLIFGAYIPVITAVKAVLSFQLSYIPNLVFFGLGILAGAVSVVKLIQACMEKFHSQTIYFVLGMMIGSLYAIVMGPTTLEVRQAPLGVGNLQILALLIGAALVIGLQEIKERRDKNGNRITNS